MTLGERISAWRKSKDLTQQDLAEACAITVSAVSYWESDDTSPSQKNLEAIVSRFGISMAQFYGPVPKPKRKAS